MSLLSCDKVYLVRIVCHFDDAVLDLLKIECITNHLDFRNQILINIVEIYYRLISHNGVIGRITFHQQFLDSII